jgi:rubrerythrin
MKVTKTAKKRQIDEEDLEYLSTDGNYKDKGDNEISTVSKVDDTYASTKNPTTDSFANTQTVQNYWLSRSRGGGRSLNCSKDDIISGRWRTLLEESVRHPALCAEIEKNIKAEADAREQYYNLLDVLGDIPEDVKIIEEIISDELNHTQQLEKLLKKYSTIPTAKG